MITDNVLGSSLVFNESSPRKREKDQRNDIREKNSKEPSYALLKSAGGPRHTNN